MPTLRVWMQEKGSARGECRAGWVCPCAGRCAEAGTAGWGGNGQGNAQEGGVAAVYTWGWTGVPVQRQVHRGAARGLARAYTAGGGVHRQEVQAGVGPGWRGWQAFHVAVGVCTGEGHSSRCTTPSPPHGAPRTKSYGRTRCMVVWMQINGGDKSMEHVQVEVGQNGCGSAWGAVWMRSKMGVQGGHKGDLDVRQEGCDNTPEEGAAAVSTQGRAGVRGGHGGEVDAGWDRKGSVESTDSAGGTGKGRCCMVTWQVQRGSDGMGQVRLWTSMDAMENMGNCGSATVFLISHVLPHEQKEDCCSRLFEEAAHENVVIPGTLLRHAETMEAIMDILPPPRNTRKQLSPKCGEVTAEVMGEGAHKYLPYAGTLRLNHPSDAITEFATPPSTRSLPQRREGVGTHNTPGDIYEQFETHRTPPTRQYLPRAHEEKEFDGG
ncbi:hypothetical protein DFH08DRAFT_800176 [Mycena albidolilacea]|uniref:Uncharacterized protein n=1 Tax=Mycena albidolilacea TaxID=1033008 RepID=A0AAD7AJE3_9AGAR|nr:hypothetical protein DFH08DRAFT_800176 [Mycena albidolilacea]